MPPPIVHDEHAREPVRTRVPRERNEAMLVLAGRRVRLTNLQKLFWPELGITKAALLQYYLDVGPFLLPHLEDRAMVMKRYPNGVDGTFFFMKRAPVPRPPWIRTCSIEHESGGVIDFPIVGDLASLAWIVNLGCVDLHPWYARCDDVERPDAMHFDLDPGAAAFEQVIEAAFVLRDALESVGMPTFVKTSGSKGLHVYVPIARGPRQHAVWSVAKAIAIEIAGRNPRLATAERRVARRPPERVLIDYDQNAFGRTLASVYSVRPTPHATVSMPVTWSELADVRIDDFRIDNAPSCIRRRGDLWAPLAHDAANRFDLARLS
jgi:bifunctional non-homologous end joining protein LigD